MLLWFPDLSEKDIYNYFDDPKFKVKVTLNGQIGVQWKNFFSFSPNINHAKHLSSVQLISLTDVYDIWYF